MQKVKGARWLPYVLLAVLALMLGFGCATAPKPDQAAQKEEAASAKSWRFHDIVDVDFVKQYAKIPPPEDVMIIDARPKRGRYDKGHILTAVSIPDTQFEKNVDKLPEKKDALLIFYCQGPKCNKSHKAARKAEKMGYTNVKVFEDGMPGWLEVPGHYACVSVDWVKQQLDKQAPMTLVDSRPKRSKYDRGHIPTAISIPYSKFDELSDKLPEDKKALIVFYCGGFKCRLSHKSAEKAIKMGYTNVKVFAAGYPAWKKVAGAKAEEEKASQPAPKATGSLKAGPAEGSVDIDVFKKIIKEKPERIMLVDVRDPDEFAAGHFKTSVNIPTDDLENQIAELPSDKPVVFVCSTGARSGEAYYMVLDSRPDMTNVYYVEAQVEFKKDGSYKITPNP